MTPRVVHVLGVPLDLGGGRRGVDMGPSALRIAGIGERLAGMGCVVVDKGDLAAPIPETQAERDPRKKYVREIARVCQKLYQQVYQAHEEGALPVVLGGDHSLAAGSVGRVGGFRRRARRRDRPALGGRARRHEHARVHDERQRARHAARRADRARAGGTVEDRQRRSPKVRAEKTVLIGVRNLDPEERERIRDAGDPRLHDEGHRSGRHREGHGAARWPSPASDTHGIHVSFDLDVCDPAIAPGVGTPVKGGLDYREAHMVMEMIADSKRLMALDLVEVNPILDTQNQTAVLGVELVAVGVRTRNHLGQVRSQKSEVRR